MPEPTHTTQAKPWIETPLIESAKLSKLAGCRVFLKLENVQPSGSFKSRGIGNHILKAIERSPPGTPVHFYISSGGNAGLAAVLAAKALGHPCTVAVPTSCKRYMITKLEVAGAERVIQHGANWRECDGYLREEMIKSAQGEGVKAVYVPPFDSEDVWDGAATMVEEWERQLASTSTSTVTAVKGEAPANGDAGVTRKESADAVICSVGGGGLFSGLCQGIESASSPTRVIAVETLGADSLHQSVKAKYLVTLPGITSIATSLGATQVCCSALAYALEENVSSLVVSDKQAVSACLQFAEEERMLVEPACGASLAVIYSGLLREVLGEVREDMKVVVVVCGGSNVGLDLLVKYKQDFEL